MQQRIDQLENKLQQSKAELSNFSKIRLSNEMNIFQVLRCAPVSSEGSLVN